MFYIFILCFWVLLFLLIKLPLVLIVSGIKICLVWCKVCQNLPNGSKVLFFLILSKIQPIGPEKFGSYEIASVPPSFCPSFTLSSHITDHRNLFILCMKTRHDGSRKGTHPDYLKTILVWPPRGEEMLKHCKNDHFSPFLEFGSLTFFYFVHETLWI